MTEYELELRQTATPGILVVEASGELDLTNATEIERRLGDLSTDATLVLDLNRVSFVDSAALHMLFRVGDRLGSERFGIALDPSASIARTLDIVGLGDLVRIRASSHELVAELAS